MRSSSWRRRGSNPSPAVDTLASIFLGFVLIVACLLAGFFIAALWNLTLACWSGWRLRDEIDDPEVPTSIGIAIAATAFSLAVYGVIIMLIVWVVS